MLSELRFVVPPARDPPIRSFPIGGILPEGFNHRRDIGYRRNRARRGIRDAGNNQRVLMGFNKPRDYRSSRKIHLRVGFVGGIALLTNPGKHTVCYLKR